MSVLLGKIDKLTPKQKRRMLADIIIWNMEYDNDIWVGRPLSFYNWDAVSKLYYKLKEEHEN